MHDPEPYAVPPGGGTTIEGPAGGPVTFKVRGEQSAGRLAALESVVAPGDGPPLHVHTAEDELIHVLEGRLRVELRDEVVDAPAGALVFIPRGAPHCFENAGTGPARLLVVFTPAGMERFFERFAEHPAGMAPNEAFVAAAREADMDVVGPPLRAGR